MIVATMSLRVRATVWQTPSKNQFKCLNDVVIKVVNGRITSIDPFAGQLVDLALPTGQVLIPGLIDLHIHAPQWPQLGTGYDFPLEEWLFKYTFPLEAKYENLDFAESVWSDMVPTLLRHGTTTAVYYSSIHVPATTALAKTCIKHGQRAWIGRVAMDHPDGTPEWYRDASATEGLAATKRSIAEITALRNERGLVSPIITPRFIPACTDELLTVLGTLAAETGLKVQTHCSESDWEHHHALQRYGISDTKALDDFGLLRPSTVLAHGVMLGEDDMASIAKARAGVAHCPLSNIYFANAVFPAARALAAGVKVGLGTDIAGGPSPSILTQVAQAVNSSCMLDQGVDPSRSAENRGVARSRITATTAFWLATLGGAEVIDEPLGLLEVGRCFDAVAVDISRVAGRADLYSTERRFEQLVRLADHSDIRSVWVDGVQVSSSQSMSSLAPDLANRREM